MNFHTYTITREACEWSGAVDAPEEFYRVAFADEMSASKSAGSHLFTRKPNMK